MSEDLPQQLPPDEQQQPMIENVPGMPPAEVQDPERTPVIIENPSPQTLRTAVGTPYTEAAPGVLVSSEAQIEPDDRPDVSKAWDMAHAGKDERDKAAKSRTTAKNIDASIDQVPDIATELSQSVEQFTEAAQQRSADHSQLFERRYAGGMTPQKKEQIVQDSQAVETTYEEAERQHAQSVDEIVSSKVPEIKTVLYTLARELLEGTGGYGSHHVDPDIDQAVASAQQGFERERNIQESHAEEQDGEAERRESWAGILHDNPLSDAYKERFGISEVTPEELVNVEYEIERFRDRILTQVAKKRYEQLRGMDADHAKKSIQMLPPAELSTLEAEAAKIDDTLDIKLKRTFLEDIRTSRAHQWE